MIDLVKKLFGTNDKVPYEAQEFQPDAIELEHHEPPVSMHFAWFIVIAAIVFLGVWASVTHVDKIVSADGKVTTIRPAITMKPLDRTTIRKVHVKVGQRVKKDELLFTFDQTVNQQELKRLKEQLRSLNAEKARLESERDGYKNQPKLPAVMNEDEVRQLNLYKSRKAYFEQKMRGYQETLQRYEHTLRSLESTLKSYEDRQAKLKEIEEMYVGLRQKNAVSLKELLSTQVDVIGTAIQLDNQKLSIIENRQQLLIAQSERDAFLSDWNRQIAEGIVNVERNITSYLREIPK